MRGMVVEYRPVTAFRLRPSNATSTSGKSLLIPTPYAIKMALLAAAIACLGLEETEAAFPTIRDLRIFLKPPPFIVVNRLIQRSASDLDALWNGGLGAREYCTYSSAMHLGFDFQGTPQLSVTTFLSLFAAIGHWGWSGGFFQFMAVDQRLVDPGAEGFIDLMMLPVLDSICYGILQRMDDMRPTAQFSDVSALSTTAAADGGRTFYSILLPYRVRQERRNALIYELLGKHNA